MSNSNIWSNLEENKSNFILNIETEEDSKISDNKNQEKTKMH